MAPGPVVTFEVQPLRSPPVYLPGRWVPLSGQEPRNGDMVLAKNGALFILDNVRREGGQPSGCWVLSGLHPTTREWHECFAYGVEYLWRVYVATCQVDDKPARKRPAERTTMARTLSERLEAAELFMIQRRGEKAAEVVAKRKAIGDAISDIAIKDPGFKPWLRRELANILKKPG